MAIINRYGNSTYGEGRYKGVFDSLTTLRGLAWSDHKKCFHYGFNDSQGFGWDEVRDGDWVWPASQASVFKLVDDNGKTLLVVMDEASGLPYVINTHEGPANSGMTAQYKDKVDPNVSGSGTDIGTECLLPDHYGEKIGYDIWHEQSRLHTRPVRVENRGASGFDANGLLTGQEFSSTLYADGKAVASSTMTNIPLTSEYVHDRKVKGNTLQQKISTNKSNYRVIRTESIYKVSDVNKMPSIGAMGEAAHEAEFATPVVWLSRGDTLLKNRYDGKTLSGAVTAIRGPDGIDGSAMSITSAVGLENAAISSGTVMLWSKTEYVITGITLVTYGTMTESGITWYLRSFSGAIPAALTLVAGAAFDVRVYNTVISAAAMEHYFDNMKNFAGRAYLPYTG